MAIDQDKKEVAGWWFWMLMLIAAAVIILSVLGYMGKLTSTAVERAVFENSYQYSEARKGEIAVFAAQLAEIESQLMNGTLDPAMRTDLEAKASAIRVQLAAARAKQ